MDPVTALGVAAGAVQLLSFAGKLLKTGREIHQAGHGTTVQNEELQSITTTLRRLSRSLADEYKKKSSSEQETEQLEVELQEIYENCQKVSNELIEALQKLGSGEKSGSFASARQAFRNVWSENDVVALERRVERYRRQIDTILLVTIR